MSQSGGGGGRGEGGRVQLTNALKTGDTCVVLCEAETSLTSSCVQTHPVAGGACLLVLLSCCC